MALEETLDAVVDDMIPVEEAVDTIEFVVIVVEDMQLPVGVVDVHVVVVIAWPADTPVPR